jgi:hypothetical protein
MTNHATNQPDLKLFFKLTHYRLFSFFCEKTWMTLIARMASPLFEIATVPASRSRCRTHRKRASQHYVNRVSDCIAYRVRLGVPQPTERQRIADETDAAFIFARADFVNVHGIAQRFAGAIG